MKLNSNPFKSSIETIKNFNYRTSSKSAFKNVQKLIEKALTIFLGKKTAWKLSVASKNFRNIFENGPNKINISGIIISLSSLAFDATCKAHLDPLTKQAIKIDKYSNSEFYAIN